MIIINILRSSCNLKRQSCPVHLFLLWLSFLLPLTLPLCFLPWRCFPFLLLFPFPFLQVLLYFSFLFPFLLLFLFTFYLLAPLIVLIIFLNITYIRWNSFSSGKWEEAPLNPYPYMNLCLLSHLFEHKCHHTDCIQPRLLICIYKRMHAIYIIMG